MIINNTNETIEIVLGGNVVSTQASFVCSFNEISPTTITPFQTNGTSNNTTVVTVMGSPSSSNQRQLREINIRNNDTSPITLIVRFNNTSITIQIYRVVLQRNETLIYTQDIGWNVFDVTAMRKLSTAHVYQTANLRMTDLFFAKNGSSVTLSNSNYAIISLGKAEQPYTQITLNYRILTAAVNITFSEMAIYRVAQPMGIGTQQASQRLGFVNTSTQWNSIGAKTTTINVSNVKKGDDLYVVLASQVTTTQPVFYAANVSDPLICALAGNNTGGVTWRPSLNEMYLFITFGNAVGSIHISWQGS
jgi:hypothetical protein